MVASQRNLQQEYNADYHLGLVPNDATEAVARENTRILTSYFTHAWAGGDFPFHRGPVVRGAANRTVYLPPTIYYTWGTIETSERIGAAIRGGIGTGIELSEGHYDVSPIGTLAGSATRIMRLDGENGGPIIRCNGGGLEMSGLQLFGASTLNSGTRSPIGIEIAGNTTPPSGRHIFRTLQIFQCETAMHASVTTDEDHADLCYFDHVHTQNCDTYFKSNSNQSVSHVFIFPFATQPDSGALLTMFDVVRGGKFEVYSPRCNGNKVLYLRVTDGMNPNANRFETMGLHWDHDVASASNYLTLFKSLVSDTEAYDVRITGHINNPGTTYNESKLVERGLTPKTGLLFDLTNLPVSNGDWELVSYPWYRPAA